uniref:MAK10-like protein n=1 Tax=Tanacetum cinerariifolium TaxID=118510 RepID=A0A6L2P6J5_TANCI|nr:MAK10-like protein [Tanacetum cinerariifolium]
MASIVGRAAVAGKLQKVPHHVSFYLKYEIDRVATGKLRDKNADESWEIIENLPCYDHEGWNDSKEFVKPVKAISTPQSTLKTPDRRLLKLKDQINFLLKGSRPTPRPSSTHIHQAYAEAVYSVSRSQNQNGTPKQNPFTFHDHTEEINDKMAEMFRLLKELTTSMALEKVLIKEYAKSPITKNINSISLARGKKERNDNDYMEADGGINETSTEMLVKEAEKETEAEKGTKNKPIKRAEREETTEASSSQPVGNSRRCISGCFWLCVPRGLRDKEDEKRPFILGTPILTTAKAVIKYDKGTITLSSRKSKISFHMIRKSLFKVEKGIKNDIEPIAPTMTLFRNPFSSTTIRVANTIRTLGDYSKPRHEGYKNTIELLIENNVVPLRSDTIQTDAHSTDIAPRVTFEARVQDYMASHTKRMERFKNAIFKQREEINDKLAEMFRLLKELTTSRALEKVFIKEEAKSPVTKNINYISLARGKEERKDNDYMVADGGINEIDTKMPVKEAEKDTEAENGTKNKPIKRAEASSSQPVGYYQKHKINEKLIKGLVDNHRFNDSLSRIRVGKVKGKTYNLLPRGPVYEAILRKMITRKEDIGGNFEIPYNIVGLKHMNALVDQGSDVNIMPLST